MRFTPTLCVLLCACLFGAQPNVVLIVADDMGWGDLGCYGSKQNSTPHVDRLAREGMKFESFYAAQAVCTSSRCALLTGCYPNRLGLGGTALPPASKVGLHPEEQTLATLLRAAGYRTGIVGKWHLGDHARFLPPAHGFDESLIVPYSNDMWPVGYFAGDTSRRKMYPELRWIVDGVPFGAIDDWTDMDNLTVMQGFRATKFIRDNAGAGRPFFLYLATSMPHTPLGASKDFKGKGPTPYAETLADLDDVVGYVLAALREKGVENDTIVIFTSDNGPWLNFGRHAGVTGGFREGKGTTWEGGVRVPCIVRWPNQVPRGVTTPALAANLDLLPTIVAACEVAGPRRPIDGQSFLSLLKGERLKARDVFPYYYGDKLEAIRQGRWKLHLPHTYRSYDDMKPAEHDGAPMKTQQKEIGFALFDLEADPGERTDVKEAHPEVVTRLKELAAKERAALDAGKRPVGRL
ncbi:arylsulfatase [Opitutia bacterium]|nr:arylsulfatase [Opitutae bacterium]